MKSMENMMQQQFNKIISSISITIATLTSIAMLAPFTILTIVIAIVVSTSPRAQAQTRSPQHQTYCLKLEADLARSMYGNSGTQDRTKIQSSIRKIERVYHRLQNDADRYNCYSYFLFSKELKRTQRCHRIDKKIRGAKNQLSRLNNELHRSADAKSNERYKQDKIISELSRNRCGRQYEREARKRNSIGNWFQDGFFGGGHRQDNYTKEDQFKFATHRTMCVRLCDGYYFPISFATTTNRFSTDETMCQERCTAPARLFTYPNPGGTTDQMLSIDGIPYNDIKHAFRFKKEFVKGCSCKLNEYNPSLLEAKPATTEQDDKEKQSSKAPESQLKLTPQKTASTIKDTKK